MLNDVQYERRGQAVWLRLNRPEALNALTTSMVEELAEGINRAGADARVRAVVITGLGRAFCAGADLRAISKTLDGRAIAKFVRRVSEVFTSLERFPKPVIAAVNGPAVAGGLELVLCCDIVIASESSTFADGHAKWGLVPGAGSTARLPRKIPANWANRMLLAGDALDARRALELGLVTDVVANDRLEEATDRLVEAIAARSPLSLARIKELVARNYLDGVAAVLEHELEVGDRHTSSPDFAEGLAAFGEKRLPQFPGLQRVGGAEGIV